MLEAIITVIAGAVLAGVLGVWRAYRRRAFWMRTIQVVSADVVVPTHHHVSAKLGVRNDAERQAPIAGALVDFEGGEQRSAEAPVAPQSGSKFTQRLEPGRNQVFVKWNRADQDPRVSRLRLRVEGHLIEAPRDVLDTINEKIAERPRR